MEVSGQLHSLATLLPERHPGAHRIGGWMGPTISLDILVKCKISCSC